MEDKHKEEECLSNGPLIDFSSVSDSRAHLSGDVPDSDRIPVNSEKMQPIANIGTADLSVNDDATDVSVVTNDHDAYLPAKPDLDEDIYKSFEITNVEEKCEILISQPITHKGNKRMIQKSIDELVRCQFY